MKKMHPSEAFELDQIATATVQFSVFFRKSPSEAYSEVFPTLAEARARAADLDSTHGKFGRRAGIYAVTAKGRRYLVPENYGR